MSDLISRQAVINAIANTIVNGESLGYGLAEEIVSEITSVENTGEWIKIQSGDKDFPESIVCSKCKNENSHLDFNEHGEPIGKVFVTSKFCPNCGADMRKAEKPETCKGCLEPCIMYEPDMRACKKKVREVSE